MRKNVTDYNKFMGIYNDHGHWVLMLFDAEKAEVLYMNSLGETSTATQAALLAGRLENITCIAITCYFRMTAKPLLFIAVKFNKYYK